METLALGRPPALPGLPEGETGPTPPGAARAETLLEVVGIGIFLALLAGTVAILIRQWRRR